MCSVFDNEEVGSGTKQGAGSTFGVDVLKYNVAQKYTTDARSAAPEKAAYIYAGQIRDELGSRLDLLEKNAYRFCYINDFPMSGTAQDLIDCVPGHSFSIKSAKIFLFRMISSASFGEIHNVISRSSNHSLFTFSRSIS